MYGFLMEFLVLDGVYIKYQSSLESLNGSFKINILNQALHSIFVTD